jgi:hypothetical protein
LKIYEHALSFITVIIQVLLRPELARKIVAFALTWLEMTGFEIKASLSRTSLIMVLGLEYGLPLGFGFAL